MKLNFPETDDRLDALWRMYSDNVTQSRHHENERGAIVGVVFTISAALIGLITFDGSISGGNDAAVAIFLFATGLFGAAFSYKNYERSCYHFQRARNFRDRIDRDYCEGEIADLNRSADRRHEERFSSFRKAKLHRWWIAMNFTIAIIAGLLIIVALFVPMDS